MEGDSDAPVLEGLEDALKGADTDFRLFGKPEIHGKRRLGVALALGQTVEKAREAARNSAASIRLV